MQKGIVFIPVIFTAAVLASSATVIRKGAHGKMEDGNPEAILILGAHITGRKPSPVLQARLDAALAYISRYPTVPVVVAGGKGRNETQTEAAVMADYLISKGVPKGRIIMEANSRNTYQNLLFTRDLLERTIDHILIVSSGYHLTRARMLAYRVGFRTVSSAPAQKLKNQKFRETYGREAIALFKSFLIDRAGVSFRQDTGNINGLSNSPFSPEKGGQVTGKWQAN